MNKIKSTAIFCIMMVAVNVIIFLLCEINDNDLLFKGCLEVTSVLEKGEFWRLFTAIFLHANIQHLFNNMLLLFFLGSMIENEIGHLPFAIIYLSAGMVGNICSLLYKILNYNFVPSVGASGAIFGLDGLLLAICLLSTRKIENVTFIRVMLMIAFSLYSGYTEVNVDNAGHVGGLFTGFVIGVIYVLIDNKKRCEE